MSLCDLSPSFCNGDGATAISGLWPEATEENGHARSLVQTKLNDRVTADEYSYNESTRDRDRLYNSCKNGLRRQTKTFDVLFWLSSSYSHGADLYTRNHAQKVFASHRSCKPFGKQRIC